MSETTVVGGNGESGPQGATATTAQGYRALTEGCALFERSSADRLEMSGADRGRFLNGLVTCAVNQLSPGSGAYGFVTSAKGKVLSDLTVLAEEESFLLELPAGRGVEVRDHLLRYRIADRVEVEPVTARLVLTVAGPRAAAVLGELLGEAAGEAQDGGGLPLAPWSHRAAEVGGEVVRLVRRALAPEEAWDLWVETAAAPAVFEALRAAGAVPAAFGDWETRRVERGLPRFGPDFGPDHLPQETGLEERAVSYEKGCYLGQEIVARIHYRGGVNRGLCGLDLGAVPPPPAGAEVLHDGRSAGLLGTAVASPALGRTIALAVLHRRAGDAGTVVEVSGTGAATVTALPFVPAS